MLAKPLPRSLPGQVDFERSASGSVRAVLTHRGTGTRIWVDVSRARVEEWRSPELGSLLTEPMTLAWPSVEPGASGRDDQTLHEARWSVEACASRGGEAGAPSPLPDCILSDLVEPEEAQRAALCAWDPRPALCLSTQAHAPSEGEEAATAKGSLPPPLPVEARVRLELRRPEPPDPDWAQAAAAACAAPSGRREAAWEAARSAETPLSLALPLPSREREQLAAHRRTVEEHVRPLSAEQRSLLRVALDRLEQAQWDLESVLKLGSLGAEPRGREGDQGQASDARRGRLGTAQDVLEATVDSVFGAAGEEWDDAGRPSPAEGAYAWRPREGDRRYRSVRAQEDERREEGEGWDGPNGLGNEHEDAERGSHEGTAFSGGRAWAASQARMLQELPAAVMEAVRAARQLVGPRVRVETPAAYGTASCLCVHLEIANRGLEPISFYAAVKAVFVAADLHAAPTPSVALHGVFGKEALRRRAEHGMMLPLVKRDYAAALPLTPDVAVDRVYVGQEQDDSLVLSLGNKRLVQVNNVRGFKDVVVQHLPEQGPGVGFHPALCAVPSWLEAGDTWVGEALFTAAQGFMPGAVERDMRDIPETHAEWDFWQGPMREPMPTGQSFSERREKKAAQR